MSGYNNIVRPARRNFDIHKNITKESLQKDIDKVSDWQAEQETAIPDNVIKGIREIENFLANTPDTETLANLLTTLTDSLTRAIAAKYTRPSSGIPSSDLTQAVQNLLTLASTALQQSDLAAILDTMQMNESTGDITLQYDNGIEEQAEE